MELLRLKKRLTIARRGHKLLKDKQEELMRHILLLLKEIREKRAMVKRALTEVFLRFNIARLYENPQFFDSAILLPSFEVKVITKERRKLNLLIPQIEVEIIERKRSYGLFQTSGELEEGIEKLKNILPHLLSLAADEKAWQLLLIEMEKTRRRVNALEYILIPTIEKTVKFIRLKLAENEREDLIRLQRIKR